jgi:hypothetical protein
MTFQQLLGQFLQPVVTHENEKFWEDQEMEKFVAEFAQWNGNTLYVNPTGSQLCYYKLPTLYDAVIKMFQAQPKGIKYSALTDEGFIEFSHHPTHDFYDINVSLIKFRGNMDIDIIDTFMIKLVEDTRIHKISFIQPSSALKSYLEPVDAFYHFKEFQGSFVLYK